MREDKPIEDYEALEGSEIAIGIVTTENKEYANKKFICCDVLDSAVLGLCGCFPDDMEFYGNDIKEFISTFLQEYKEG